MFTRSQLLQEVWGYDYFGGTSTVDVHVRRLRAKLGAENEALIGTVRNVGYKFVPPARTAARADGGSSPAGGSPPADDRGRGTDRGRQPRARPALPARHTPVAAHADA